MKLLKSLQTRWVIWVWNHTPNCADMSRLASQALDRKLPLTARCQMRLHQLICVWCQRYSKQLRFLHESAPRFEEYAGALPGRGLSTNARRRILAHLQEMKS